MDKKFVYFRPSLGIAYGVPLSMLCDLIKWANSCMYITQENILLIRIGGITEGYCIKLREGNAGQVRLYGILRTF